MRQTVKDICDEYYTQFRGQATNLPTFGNREFTLAVILLRSAIKKWDRADGQLWRELNTTLAAEKLTDGTIVTTVASALIAAPLNMRKPPGKVTFTLTNGNTAVYKTVEPQNGDKSTISFIGSSNRGYTMRIGADLITALTGATFDYEYFRQPVMPEFATDSSTTLIDMSDPTFAVQYMLASRFQNTRNGFGYKTAMAEAKEALANMKLENNSGVYGNSEAMTPDTGWGAAAGQFGDMRL